MSLEKICEKLNEISNENTSKNIKLAEKYIPSIWRYEVINGKIKIIIHKVDAGKEMEEKEVLYYLEKYLKKDLNNKYMNELENYLFAQTFAGKEEE